MASPASTTRTDQKSTHIVLIYQRYELVGTGSTGFATPERGPWGLPGGYQRTKAAPQVKPPPMASSSRRSPRLMRRSASASASASGIDAADVLPWRSTVVTIFAGAIPSLCAE